MPHKQLWKVTPDWKGETAYIIAGGPSVLMQNLRVLKGRRVIVINSSYEAYPEADILFFGDKKWLNEHITRDLFRAFKGRHVTINSQEYPDMPMRRLKQVRPAKCGGFSEDRTGVCGLRTNLQGAMNLAAHLGVVRIVLLGADMKRSASGRTHHHRAHPWPNKPGNRTWSIQMRELRLIAPALAARNIEVINTSLDSRIDWWPKMSLTQAILLERRDIVKRNEPVLTRIAPSNMDRDAQALQVIARLQRRGGGRMSTLPHHRRFA